MTRVLHISDTHFGTEIDAVVNALGQTVREVRPDLVLLSGDITQRARRGQFAAARAFVQSLDRPVLVVPGNHDIPLFNVLARVFNPYGNYRRALGVNLEPVFEDERLLVVGVNSTRPSRRKHGEVSPAQVQRVAQRLRMASPAQLRIVMLHHPVMGTKASDAPNLLVNREQAVPAWVDAGADLILAGHIHLPFALPLAGLQGRRGWAVQAGTALSRRRRGGISNSINLIDYDPAGECLLQRWDFESGAARFQPAGEHRLSLSR